MCVYIYVHAVTYVCVTKHLLGTRWARRDLDGARRQRSGHRRSHTWPSALTSWGMMEEMTDVEACVYTYTYIYIYNHIYICIYIYIIMVKRS